MYHVFFVAQNSKFQYTFYEDNDSGNVTDLLTTEMVQATAKHVAEITRYLKYECTNDINDLEQLKIFEVIKKLYMKFNVITASESDVERLFSFGGMIMRPHRRHMKSSLFEKIIVLKSNCYPHRDDHNKKI